MKLPLPPDVEFHEDIGLVVHRTQGLLNRTAINKMLSILGELQFTLKRPFNRILDTTAADAVDLNLEYIRRVSLYRRRVYGNRPSKNGDSRDRFQRGRIWQFARLTNRRFSDRSSCIPRSHGSNAEIGYRALAVDYDNDGLLFDTTMHGPKIATGITF